MLILGVFIWCATIVAVVTSGYQISQYNATEIWDFDTAWCNAVVNDTLFANTTSIGA